MSAGLGIEELGRASGALPADTTPSPGLRPDNNDSAHASTLSLAPHCSTPQKIGIDANRPIDPRTGRIAPQGADPDLIASTGTGWVRLNFVLKPWTSPHDQTPCGGRTWAQAYSQIVSGYRDSGLAVYGLIGVESTPGPPGDRFRDPPPKGAVRDAWIDQYVENFVAIVRLFHQDVQVFESFNEPDDWHGQERNWVHPGWFAIMLQRIHAAVRRRPELKGIRLVSGPLQGLEANRNAAVHYLQDTYRAGKARFGWTRKGVPVPFDGVGYHLYVKGAFNPDRKQRKRAVRATCRRYLEAMHQVVRQEEGRDRPLYVSEVGWNSRIDRQLIQQHEEFQADCLRAGLETVCTDPLVALGVWFCTQDFGASGKENHFGLYRGGQFTPEAQKPAYHAFRALCQETGTTDIVEDRLTCTNQQLIEAFHSAGQELEMHKPWDLLAKAGLSLRALAANRQGAFEGPPIDSLPGLSDIEKAAIQTSLDGQGSTAQSMVLGAAAFRPGAPGLADLATPHEGTAAALESGMALDLSIALQDQVLEALERNSQLLTQVLDKLECLDYAKGEPPAGETDSGKNDVLNKVRGLLS